MHVQLQKKSLFREKIYWGSVNVADCCHVVFWPLYVNVTAYFKMGVCLNYAKRLNALCCFRLQYFVFRDKNLSCFHLVYTAEASRKVSHGRLAAILLKGSPCEIKTNKRSGKVVQPVPHSLAIMQ